MAANHTEIVTCIDLRYALAATMLQRIDSTLKQEEAELVKHAKRIEALLVEREKVMGTIITPPFSSIKIVA